jgi:mannose-6-phosphate isomerase-like protein (cupin superfamily)
MNRVFGPLEFFPVPDGTLVSPFLNPMDVNSALPPGVEVSFSLAAGTIEEHGESKIHVHPHIAQVTYVVEGSAMIKMKDPGAEQPYVLVLEPTQAALTGPGTFLQLINSSDVPASLLYIVGPPYVFEIGDHGRVVYDDAIILDEDWDELSRLNWHPPQIGHESNSLPARQRATERVMARITKGRA